jgi:UDP-N-acetylmuramoyl-tripeptide--D-alanyl-D-alanine ligase
MIIHLYTIFKKSAGISTDTRTLKAGELYFALTGDNFDGNEYIKQALDKGASHVVTNDRMWKEHNNVSVVKDTLSTLQQLSTHHRKQLTCPILALTGSNGKTTTKELILSVLKTQYNVQGTKGNFNNHIGVPLTLLTFNSTTEIGIVEMGANHQKEIEFLCNIALPNFGLITNYGKAHLEGFGGVEGVIKGKSEMYAYLNQSQGTAIVGRWDKKQLKKTESSKRILTLANEKLDRTDPYVTCTLKGIVIHTHLTGSYNYNNVLFAASVGELFDVSIKNTKTALEGYLPANNRSQIIVIDKATIILDAYNANPSSMKVALSNLSKQKQNNKVAILGDMFEMGEYSREEHQQIADLAQSLNINKVILIGEHFYQTKTNALKFNTYDAFQSQFHLDSSQETVYLIKGSRGMRLERIMKEQNKK